MALDLTPVTIAQRRAATFATVWSVQGSITAFAQAWRALARRPLFTVATLLTLTAGIGVTTAVFSTVDRVLIRPLPFPNADQLGSVYEASPSRAERTSLVALRAWRTGTA